MNGYLDMVELDKENTDRISEAGAGTSCDGGFKTRELHLFVKKIFFGPIELNPNSNVTFKWDNNPKASGTVKFQILHGKRDTKYKITFEMFEGCFGFISNEQQRHALILKFRNPCQKKLFKNFSSPAIMEQIRQYSLTDSSPPFFYLTIILNEVPTRNVPNAIAEDEKNKLFAASELKNYMLQNMQAKFQEDGKERYFKVKRRDPVFDHCFYDVINADNFAKYLKTVGIKISRHKSSPPSYEGTMPMANSNFELQHSTPSNSSENVSRDISNEFLPGKKTPKKPQHPQFANHGRQPQHGQQPQQLNLPLSSLALDHKQPQQQQQQLQQHGVLGKRPRSRMEKEITPPQVTRKVEQEEEEDGEDMEDEDEEMDLDEEEDDEEREEYSESPPEKKSSTPEIVDLESDEEEQTPSPVKKPKPRDILMTYKSTTLHFEDMKGLFFDEMVNDTIVDLYLSMMKDEEVKIPMREKTHVFSCFFYKRLTEGMGPLVNYKGGEKAAGYRFASIERNYGAISKWTRKVDLFKMDYVVIPVVDDLHWYLIIIMKPYKCIVPSNGVSVDNAKARVKGYGMGKGKESTTYAIMLDSLFDAGDQKRQTSIDIIRDYLELEYTHKKGVTNDGMVFDRSRIGVLRPKGLPQQSNFLDCGFFLMKYAQTFLTKPPAEKMLRKGVYWKDWYVGFEIAVRYMRELVARTIENKTDKKVWKEYKSFEKSRRDDWEPARKQKESLHIARCRRYPSEEPRPNGVKRVRRHSEPPSLSIPMASHFH